MIFLIMLLKWLMKKTNQVMNEVEKARNKVNTDVKINVYTNINDSVFTDIEIKVDNMSSNTSYKMLDISENIAKNIMSI